MATERTIHEWLGMESQGTLQVYKDYDEGEPVAQVVFTEPNQDAPQRLELDKEMRDWLVQKLQGIDLDD